MRLDFFFFFICLLIFCQNFRFHLLIDVFEIFILLNFVVWVGGFVIKKLVAFVGFLFVCIPKIENFYKVL